MNFCSNCGAQLGEDKNCPRCVVKSEGIAQPVIQQTNTQDNIKLNEKLPKDNYGLTGFICGIIGFLCCTYVAIPGLIFSVISITKVKSGQVDSKNKWQGILGLIFSIIGLIIMIVNIVTMVAGVNPIYNMMTNK